MRETDHIIRKLEAFISKYYINKLLRGTLLFLTIGLLYVLATVFLENVLWLNSTGRSILFWSVVAVELFLFLKFILWPISQLLKWSKGISKTEAAQLIGKYFPEVDDKLLNILQLHAETQKEASEFLAASIAQKSKNIALVPFSRAVTFKNNLKYLKYLAIPIAAILLVWWSGNAIDFTNSYQRLVNYQQAYTPPAPFHFVILNDSLQTEQKRDFVMQIKTVGELLPEEVQVMINGETYVMTESETHHFSYRFKKPEGSIVFQLQANEVISPRYTLQVTAVPQILEVVMQLDFPDYTQRKAQKISGSGNAQIPEGTKVNWVVRAKNTTQLSFETSDTTQFFKQENQAFTYKKQVFQPLKYKLSTSNQAIENYENLAYQITVIKDAYPQIKLTKKVDTVNTEKWYFKGEISDDYGLSKLQLVYFPTQNPQKIQRKELPIQDGIFDQFYSQFPGDLSLQPGGSYTFYFEVFDNDAINGAKKTQSEQFVYYKKSAEEQQEVLFENTKSNLKQIGNRLQDFQKSTREFENLKQLNLQKQDLNYRERSKFKDYIDQSLREEQELKSALKKMQTDLKAFESPENKAQKNSLQARMKRSEKRLEASEKIMKELQKYWQKIPADNMVKMLDKVAKRKKNHSRNLKQLLELTKRYYVTEKTKALAQHLNRLADQQEKLADKNLAEEAKKQKELNEKFSKITKELQELKQENQNLKQPFQLKTDEEKAQKITREQDSALEKLKDEPSSSQSQKRAQPHQQSAAQKMKSMSRAMMSNMQSGNQQQLKADVKLLRLILDNLIHFSESQEQLMTWFEQADEAHPNFGAKLRRQQVLKDNFEHVDDSLYTLALRNPMISDKVLNTLNEVSFNIDKAIERLGSNMLNPGTSSQHYVMTYSNELSNMLDDILQNMQMQMQGSGSGQGMPKPGQGQQKGRGFQLPDIIKKQQQLGEKMKGLGQKSGQEKGEQPGKQSGNQGEKSGQSSQGQNGKNGKASGKNGSQKTGGVQGQSERWSEEIYQIYKQQMQLKQELKTLLQQKGYDEKYKALLRKMDELGAELLRDGVSRKSQIIQQQLQQELWKLKNAAYRQQQKNERQSQTNLKEFANPVQADLKKVKDYFHTTEILNRQSLPLQPYYKRIVQDYFINHDRVSD